jgi:HEAT repeat protein
VPRKRELDPAFRSRLQDASVKPWEIASLLTALGLSREPAALPVILPYLLAEDSLIARAASLAAHQILAAAPVAELIWLDQELRSSPFYARVFQRTWVNLRPEDLDRLGEPTGVAFSLLAIAGSHWNGHVREAAVRRLARIEDGRELPFLLLRANDWVEPVARAARASLSPRLRPEYAPHLVASLPLILDLRDGGRRRPFNDFAEDAVALLTAPESRGALASGLEPERERDVRRACAALLFSPSTSPRAEEIERGLGDRDPILRLQAARRLPSLPPGEAKVRLLALARRDPFMPVRREAFEESARSAPETATAEMEAALLDPHAAMRDAARFFLARESPRDFKAVYLQALDQGAEKILVPALAGLGETGSQPEAEAVLPFLHHPRAKVRTTAIRTLGKLDAQRFLPTLLDVPRTDVGKPVREALRILRPNVFQMGSGRIWAAFASAESPRAKLAYLQLLASFSKWESLPHLVKAAAEADPEVSEAARLHLRRWLQNFNRSFTNPSADQLQSIGAAMAEAGGRLPPDLRRGVAFLLDQRV